MGYGARMSASKRPVDGVADLVLPQKRRPLREAQKEFTRQLLLASAIEIFADRGYLRTSVSDIVAAASTTRATFYQHFSGKREVIKVLFEDLAQRARELPWTPYGLNDHPVTRERLREWLVRKIEFAGANRIIFEAVEDACAEDVEFRALWQAVVNSYVDDLTPHLESAGCRYPARVYALLLTLQTERFLSFWVVRGGQPVDAAVALETLTDIWADALGAGSAGLMDGASGELPLDRIP